MGVDSAASARMVVNLLVAHIPHITILAQQWPFAALRTQKLLCNLHPSPGGRGASLSKRSVKILDTQVCFLTATNR